MTARARYSSASGWRRRMRTISLVALVTCVAMVTVRSLEASPIPRARALIGAEVAITELHDDEGVYSPVVHGSGCVVILPGGRWCVAADAGYGSWDYTAMSSAPLPRDRTVHAAYLDVVPGVHWDLGSRAMAYAGVGLAFANVSIDRWVDSPEHRVSSDRNFGGHFGLCLGAGFASRLAGRLSVMMAARDRFVTGKRTFYPLSGEQAEERVPLGGLEFSLGIGFLL